MKKVLAFLGWSYALVISLIYASVVAGWAYLRTYTSFGTPSPYAPILILVFLLITLGVCIALIHACRRREYAHGYRLPVFLILFTIPLLWLMHDAPPIENDYGMKDIVVTDSAVLKSYDTLMLLRKDGGLQVNVSDRSVLVAIDDSVTGNCTNSLAHSNEIERAWGDLAPVRTVIEKLDSYPGIVDVTPEVRFGTNMVAVNGQTLRHMSWTYAAYTRLKTAEGLPEDAARQLATLHHVARKAFAHAVILFDKMIWAAIANINFHTASAILNDSHCTPRTVDILMEAFTPIPKEDASISRTMTAVYVYVTSFCQDELKPSNFIDTFTMTEIVLENGKERVLKKEPSLFHQPASYLAYYLTFRKNRTCRTLRKQFDLLIENTGKWPPDLSNANAVSASYLRCPEIRNIGGWVLFSEAVPDFTKAANHAVRIKILSDLLATEIANRLNQPLVLNDCYTEKPYENDKQTGRPYSVGPDGKPGTADDISLWKN